MGRETVYSVKRKTSEYFYCKDCKTIRYASELEVTPHGIQCLECGGYDVEEPRWVKCPYRRGAMKCGVGGRTLVKVKNGYECYDRCRFLMRYISQQQ